ncbi:MAG: AMP-binding protein [Candidatus Omnitrophica bacterium]|nr:AMP-binding protein [Candidatus Omnitrophota bacterium]
MKSKTRISVNELFEAVRKRYSDNTALQAKREDGYSGITFRELGDGALRLSAFLISLGVARGDKVAIISENRPEWGLTFFSICSAGAVAVPVDIKLTIDEILPILRHAEAKAIFVSGKFLKLADILRRELPSLKCIIALDEGEGPGSVLLDKILAVPKRVRFRRVYEDETALIIYTSGTTGRPKGVELTYGNLLYQVFVLYDILHYSRKDRFVSMLPLHHTFEITSGLLAPLSQGITVTYVDTLKSSELLAVLREVRPSICIVVPIILKLFLQGIEREITALPPIKRQFAGALIRLSSFAARHGFRIGKWLFPMVHERFGGKVRYFISGGAALELNVAHSFDRLGFLVLQGYGLTETSPVLSVNTCVENRYGSVGRPLPCVKVKIDRELSSGDREGEIMIKGPNVMRGYYKALDLTDEVLDGDGWFRTGDLGWVDGDGYLYITGRKKNLIVTGGGKNVHPEEVEEALSRSPLIKELCVFGRSATRGLRKGCEEAFAVIVPNVDACQVRNIPLDAKSLHDIIKSEVARLSLVLAEYKRLSGFQISMEELPKTTTRKIRRKDVVKQFLMGISAVGVDKDSSPVTLTR